MDQAELDRRFDYHPPSTPGVAGMHENARAAFKATAALFNDLLPDGREKACLMTHLEEALFWANAAIARGQVEAPLTNG